MVSTPGLWPGASVAKLATLTVPAMLLVLFAKPIYAATGMVLFQTLGNLGLPWFVAIGTALALVTGAGPALFRRTS